MADLFDARLKMRLQESGGNSGQWGDLLNQTITNVASVFGFGTHQLTADSDATLTLADDGASLDALKSSYLKITSSVSLTATRVLTFSPNTFNQVKYIENATTGSQSITISQGSGANVTIATGKTAVVYFDGAGSGAAVVDALTGVDPGVTDTLTEVLAAGNATGGTDIAVGTGDDITFADNSKAIFGAGPDLQIYHDGNNSLIKDTGTGGLSLSGSVVNMINTAATEFMLQATEDGAVNLYHDGSAKLATTSTGIDVTGGVTLSGNLLVGTTQTFPAFNNVVGAEVGGFGMLSASRDGAESLQLNRKTSDGAIALFKKDGSDIGSIGTTSGGIYLGSPSGAGKYLANNGNFSPSTDGSKNLGDSSLRWQDLYLSGGAYLGGTGTANHLDDYEEGSHEPTVTGSAGGSFTLASAGNSYSYTKIGRTVHVQGYLLISGGSGSGSLRISMPFTAASLTDDQGYSFGSALVQNNGTTVTGQKYSFVSDGANYFDIYKVNDAGSAAGFQAGDCDTNFQIGFNFSFIAS